MAASPVAVVSGKGSGRVSAAGLICFKPGARSRFFYQIRVHTGRKGERRSMSEADYAGLVTAAHNLCVPRISSMALTSRVARLAVPP